MKSVYDVITEPPLSGASHLMSTLVPLIVVVGLTGTAGTYAAKIEITELNGP